MSATLHHIGTEALSYLTVQQVAEIAQLEHKAIRRAITAGRLQAFRVGNRIRIREEDARAWIEARPVSAGAPRPIEPPARRTSRTTPRRGPTGSVAVLKQLEEATR